MYIFVIVGMPAAGKNVARIYAESHQYPYFATGDIVREEVIKRNLSADGQNVAMVSGELRGDDGMGVTRIALLRAIASQADVIFMEGMRSLQEIELIRKSASCCVVAFIAPRSLRLERVASRGRPDDSPEAFNERDSREISYGTAIPIALADEYILNTAALEDALSGLETIVQGRLSSGISQTRTGIK